MFITHSFTTHLRPHFMAQIENILIVTFTINASIDPVNPDFAAQFATR